MQEMLQYLLRAAARCAAMSPSARVEAKDVGRMASASKERVEI